jgi:hypothetical protein
MNFSIAAIMRRLCAPRHELSCSPGLWEQLLAQLRARGAGRTESGAFLLGKRDKQGRARIVDFVLYDDLDPNSLSTGIVRFDGRYFSELWAICEASGLTVVAGSGHLALIVPNFARAPVSRTDVGIYRYGGAGRWETILARDRRAFFALGL